jgi:predicted aspartyl protease
MKFAVLGRKSGFRQLVLAGMACQLMLFAAAVFGAGMGETATQARASGSVGVIAMTDGTANSVFPPEEDKLKTAIATDRIQDALIAARVCRNSASKENKPRMALNCNAILRDAAYYLGDAHAVLESVHWQSRHARSGDGLAAPFQDGDVARTVAPLSVSFEGSDSKLEYVHPFSLKRHLDDNSQAVRVRGDRPAVMVRINDQDVAAMVDTGTYVPLMLDQAHAYQVGAVPLVTGVVAPRSLAVPSPLPDSAAYDLIGTFRFGGVVMRNVLAIVVRNGHLPGGAIVGLPVLARYKQVTFGTRGVTLSGAADSCDGTQLPLTVTPASQGFGLVFPVEVHGKSVKAMFDTGSNALLLANPVLFSNSLVTKSESSTTSFEHRSLSVWIGRLHLMTHRAPLGVDGMSADVHIGAPLLAAADVRINFSNRSLCVIPTARRAGSQ